MDNITQMKTFEDSQNRTVTGLSARDNPVARAARTHQDYWKTRVKHRTFTARDGHKFTPPELYVRIFHEKREVWFCLDTANRAAAAVKARDIYLSLVAAGWDATLAKFKPKAEEPNEVCTVGEFLADVLKRSHLKPITVRRYAVKMRKMISDLAKLETGKKGRALRRSKFDYVNGGRKAWLALVDGQPLDLLTPESVNSWRNGFVAKAGTDPVKRKSAERSAASYMRGVRSLFTADVLGALKVKLPPSPFAGVKLRDPGPQRYHSDVSAEWLLAKANEELSGLRFSEADDVLAGFDTQGRIIFWELASGNKICDSVVLREHGSIFDLKINRQSNRAVCAYGAALALIDLNSGKVISNYFCDSQISSVSPPSATGQIVLGTRLGQMHFLHVPSWVTPQASDSTT